jgi:predicted SAM-dependent methyltransferase
MRKHGLNLGSGQRAFSSTPEIEWCNVDKIAHEGMPAPDLICDALNLPFLNESAHYVVLHHVLEHFGCGEGSGLIREAHRVLKPGGSLLIFVPDMKALAQRWVEGGIEDFIFFVNAYGAYMGHEEDRHKWGYTMPSLINEVTCVEWYDVKPFDWRDIFGMSAARDWWILAMECVR